MYFLLDILRMVEFVEFFEEIYILLLDMDEYFYFVLLYWYRLIEILFDGNCFWYMIFFCLCGFIDLMFILRLVIVFILVENE